VSNSASIVLSLKYMCESNKSAYDNVLECISIHFKFKANVMHMNDMTLKCICNSLNAHILQVSDGGDHWLVKDPETNQLVTVIPHTVKQNGTCRSIIKTLNERCDDKASYKH